MKQISFRIWIGAGLVLLGMLMLLERFGLFRGITNYFWGLLFLRRRDLLPVPLCEQYAR